MSDKGWSVADEPSLSLAYPPFPRLEWEEPFWTARVVLDSWQDFQPAYKGRDATPRRRKKAAGPAELSVVLPDELTFEGIRAIPSPGQAAAYGYLLDHETEVQAAILRAVFRAYPEFRDKEGYWAEDEEAEEALKARIAPPLKRPEELKALIGLRAVHILRVTRAGFAYVGFEFDCTWDSEHGLGVMTHKRRVVEVGEADSSFEEEVAEADAKPRRKRRRKRGRG